MSNERRSAAYLCEEGGYTCRDSERVTIVPERTKGQEIMGKEA